MEAVEVRLDPGCGQLRDCVSHAKRLLEPEDGAPLTPGGRKREFVRFFLLAMVLVSLLGNVAYALHHSHEVAGARAHGGRADQAGRLRGRRDLVLLGQTNQDLRLRRGGRGEGRPSLQGDEHGRGEERAGGVPEDVRAVFYIDFLDK